MRGGGGGGGGGDFPVYRQMIGKHPFLNLEE